MRKLRLALLAAALVGAVGASTPALAGGRGGSHSGHAGSHSGRGAFHHGHAGSHHGHGFRPFRPGFAVGLFAPAYVHPYVYPYPAPIYEAPPPPTCYTTPGYWIEVPSIDATGYVTYLPAWVPDRTACQ